MTRIQRAALLALATLSAASTASAEAYRYEFKTFYDTSTVLNWKDTKDWDKSVATLEISDISGGVKFTLHYNETDFPGASFPAGAPFVDELWLGGGKGTLKRSSGPELSIFAGYSPAGFWEEGNKYNWDIQFKANSFSEGNKSTFTILGTGLTANSFIGVTPMLELENVGRPYGGLFGWTPVHFIGSPVAIPEPSTYALMGLGLVGIGLAARRARKA